MKKLTLLTMMLTAILFSCEHESKEVQGCAISMDFENMGKSKNSNNNNEISLRNLGDLNISIGGR